MGERFADEELDELEHVLAHPTALLTQADSLRLIDELRLAMSEWRDCEARLDAVIALCDSKEWEWYTAELMSEIRAAATGDDHA